MKNLAKELQMAMIARGKTLGLAESCTGGAIAAALTLIPDASKFFVGSIVAYSNAWKERFLGVLPTTLQTHSAVSLPVVKEMAQGIFERTSADFVAAVTGSLGKAGQSVAFVAIAERGGKVDAGEISVPQTREEAIQFLVKTILTALLKRVVHQQNTFHS